MSLAEPFDDSDALPVAEPADVASARPARAIPWNGLLFGSLVIALLIPLWTCAHFPSQDGPAHAYAAVVARDYDRPDRPRFREFFEKNDALVPNWMCPHLLPMLAEWVSAETAVKLILSAYLILLPISVRYALQSIRKRAAGLAIAIFPLVPNFYYHEGFLDYCVALPIFFVIVGYWFNHRRRWRPGNTAILATLLIIGYMCHLVPTAMAGMFLVLLALMIGGGGMRERLGRLMPVILAGLPVMLLTVAFVVSRRGESVVGGYPYPTHLSRLRELFRFQKAFASWNIALAAANLCMFAGLSAWLLLRQRQSKRCAMGRSPAPQSPKPRMYMRGSEPRDARHGAIGRRQCARPFACLRIHGLLLVAGICSALFLFAPDAGAGGSLLVVRLAMYPFIALLFWWALQPIGSAAFGQLRLASSAISAGITICLLLSMAVSYRTFSPYFADLDAAVAQITPNSTLLFTSLSTATLGPDGRLLSHGPDIFLHGYQNAGKRGLVIVDSGIAITSYHGIEFRPELNPHTDALIEFTAHARRIGKPIEYVLLWTGGNPPDTDDARRVYQQLAGNYDLVYTSPATGYAKLYRLRSEIRSPRARPLKEITLSQGLTDFPIRSPDRPLAWRVGPLGQFDH